MQSSRDSSILRSLAIAFGDGLAFGVGMKISQQAAGRAGSFSSVPAFPEPPVLDRLEEIERRVQKVEQLPAALASAAPGGPFDQKVLEAVVGALDARLLEQTTQTERRLRDLEAKLILELKTLHQQDQSVATSFESRLGELHEQFSGQVGEIRRYAETSQAAYRTELAALHRQFAIETAKAVEAELNAKGAQIEQRVEALGGALEEQARAALARHQNLETGMAAQSAGLDRRIEEMRATLASEAARLAEDLLARDSAAINQQIADLRQTLEDHAETVAARHQALESGVAAQSAGLDQRIEEMRATASKRQDEALGSTAAETARLLEDGLARAGDAASQQIGHLRGVFDRHAQLSAERQQAIEEKLTAQASGYSVRLEETRVAFVTESARQMQDAIGRSNADVARQLADLRDAFNDQTRASAARESENLARFESRMAAMHSEFTATAAYLVRERVNQAIEDQVVPLRAEIATRDRELQQLRQKLAESDRSAASMILAIGQACRDAAERIAPAVGPEPAKSETPEAPETPAGQPTAASGSDEGLPGFAQSKPPGKLLRIPLVSSMAMVIAAGAALLHYL